MARKKAGTRVKKDIKKQTSVLHSDEEEFREIDKRFHREEDDEVDDFYKKKDKILLAGRDEESDSEPEQVYGMSSDDDDESEEENELLNEDYANDMVARFVKKKELDSDIEEQEEDIPDGKAWGRKRQDFYDNDYNVKDTAGATMSEQDRQVAKMEEEEALAIQKRLASEVDEDVFGLDDLHTVTEEDTKAIGVLDISKLPRKKLLRMVEEESPELQGLVDDCRDKLRELDQELTPLIDLMKSGKLPRGTSAENYIMLRHNLLLSYTTNVCFYLSLKAKRVSIKSHPIIKRLGQFKKLITELDSTREKILPLIQLILEKARRGESFKIFKEKNSEEDDQLESSEAEDDDEEDEVDEELSDDDIEEDAVPMGRGAKRTLDSAEQEISALYDDIKKSKKFKGGQDSEEEKEVEDDPAAIFGDTDSENDEPVFLEGEAGEEDEDDDSEKGEPLQDPSQRAPKDNDEEEENDDDGRRAINYQIAKNKGLTPKRKKEYRNPRVRHRIKYRKANIRRKGQVRAMRNESGHYGGEMSGINKQVVKSVKLK